MALISKSALRTEITSQFPTQHINLITASDLRDITTDIVDSMVHITGGVTVASGNGVASVGAISGSSQGLLVEQGLQVYGAEGNMKLALAIPISGVTGVAGSYPTDAIRVVQHNGLGFSFLKFGKGFRLTPSLDGSVLIEAT